MVDRKINSNPISGSTKLVQHSSIEKVDEVPPMVRGSHDLWAPAAYRFIGQVLQALGVVSLLQGSLDITFGLEQALSYYHRVRSFLLLPSELVGVAIPPRYADLWIIAAVFYTATGRSSNEEDNMIAKNFLGSLVLFYPFISTSVNLGKLLSAAGQNVQLTADFLPVPWLIVVILAMTLLGFWALWLGLFALIGAFSVFYWPIVAVLPFTHMIVVSVCNRLASLRISPWLSKLPLAVYGPGLLIAKLLATLNRQPLSFRHIAHLQRSYWQQLSYKRVKGYYMLLAHYAFGTLFVVLTMKLFIDTVKLF